LNKTVRFIPRAYTIRMEMKRSPKFVRLRWFEREALLRQDFEGQAGLV
jgi:hypothetical protein